MTPLTPFRMLVSSHDGWDELSTRHPTTTQTFFRVVLPASLLASAMLMYAAYFHRAVYAPDVPPGRWLMVALLFLPACWLSVHQMASFIRYSVHTAARPPYAECYRLAALTPLPIWLSSLSLFAALPAFNAAMGVLGLLASGLLTYHGLDALFEHDDSVRTESLAYTVFSVGAMLWAVLAAMVVIPIML